MRTALLFATSLLLAAPTAHAAEAAAKDESTVALPAPKVDGKVAVEKALKDRRSLRTPAPTPLTLEQVSQLCWAAQGVTDEKGHRTAPSALGTYPLELYVLAGAVTGLAPGLYHYDPAKHALRLVSAGDKRNDLEQKAIGQGWSNKAPAVFVLSGVAEKMAAKMKDRGVNWMYVEAGLAAQGFFLEATALGLGSTYVGGFKPAEAKSTLGLPANEEVLAVLPVGKRQ